MKRTATTPLKKPFKKPKLQRSNSLVNPVQYRKKPDEKKNIDVNTAATIIFGQATVSTLTHINPITQGAAGNQRIGRESTMRSIHYRWIGSLAPTTTGTSALRLLIIYDKQPNKALPGITDVLTIDSIESPMNLDNNKRFVILVDQEVECIGTQGPQSWYIKGYRKIGLPTEFFNTGGSIASCNTGSVIAITYQNGNLLIANPSSQLYTRIRFDD